MTDKKRDALREAEDPAVLELLAEVEELEKLIALGLDRAEMAGCSGWSYDEQRRNMWPFVKAAKDALNLWEKTDGLEEREGKEAPS